MIHLVDFEELRAEVPALPVEERAELAYVLLRSLDGEDDADAEAAWIAELDRRIDGRRRSLTGPPGSWSGRRRGSGSVTG